MTWDQTTSKCPFSNGIHVNFEGYGLLYHITLQFSLNSMIPIKTKFCQCNHLFGACYCVCVCVALIEISHLHSNLSRAVLYAPNCNGMKNSTISKRQSSKGFNVNLVHPRSKYQIFQQFAFGSILSRKLCFHPL